MHTDGMCYEAARKSYKLQRTAFDHCMHVVLSTHTAFAKTRTEGAKVEQRRVVRGAGLRARGGEYGVGAGDVLGTQVLREEGQ